MIKEEFTVVFKQNLDLTLLQAFFQESRLLL